MRISDWSSDVCSSDLPTPPILLAYPPRPVSNLGMRTLFHLALSPQSRLVRLVFGEKRMEAHLRAEPIWDRREDFLAINPAGEVPVMVEEDRKSTRLNSSH